MDFIQLLPLLIGMAAAVGLVMAAFIGPSTRKQVQRRLSGVRYRHSESSEAKVESQMKKAMAARKPKVHKVAGSGSRTEALAIRITGRCSKARTGNDARRRDRRGQVLAARGHWHHDDVERLLTARRSCRLLALDVHKDGVRRA